MAEIAHCAFKNELSAGIKKKLPESFIFSFFAAYVDSHLLRGHYIRVGESALPVIACSSQAPLKEMPLPESRGLMRMFSAGGTAPGMLTT